jgi:UPF0042 nucleotide-binding protein
MKIECRSFGFKNGADAQSDFVFDVRCLPNPFYIDNLKHKTGLDKPVRDYILADEGAQEYLKKVIDMLLFVISIKEKYGIEKLTVAFGCTGGHHRSVTFAVEVSEFLKQKGYAAYSFHRDINIED